MGVEVLFKAWFSELKSIRWYKAATWGAFVSLALLVATSIVILGVGALITILGVPLTTTIAILGAIWFLLVIYLQQIGVGIIFSALDGEKDYVHMLKTGISKMRYMGTAYLVYQIVALAILSPGLVYLAQGFLEQSWSYIGIGTLLILVLLAPTLIAAFFMALAQIVAYKESLGIKAVERSVQLIRSNLVDAFVFFFGAFLVLIGVSTIINSICEIGLYITSLSGGAGMLMLPIVIVGALFYATAIFVSSIFSFALVTSAQYVAYNAFTKKRTKRTKKRSKKR